MAARPSSVSTQSDSKPGAAASRRRRSHKEESDWSQRLSQMWPMEGRSSSKATRHSQPERVVAAGSDSHEPSRGGLHAG
eukprot:3657345-Rhodomonas_salina.3